MVPLERFLAAVEDIAGEDPRYREGGLGRDGTCDCIGLIMGALTRCGAEKWPMHSSNYAARYEAELTPVTEKELVRGMAVFKARDGASSLNARYLPGGRYYTGDLNDYYHVGAVTSISPLCITHCTSGGGANGIVRDTKIGEWRYGGLLNDVDYTSTEAEEEELTGAAKVISSDGNPVRLRAKPSTLGKTLIKVPTGTIVDITESAGEWCTVEWSGYHGYMMTKFLQAFEDYTQLDRIEDMLDRILLLLEGGGTACQKP